MHFSNWTIIFTWVISLVSILLMLLRPRGIAEYIWICLGALTLVLAGALPLSDAAHAIYEGLDVYLFLAGMMILAELARHEGVFDWVADVAVHHSNGSPARLFLLIYLAGTVVTIFLSNDATAVVLTPAVLAAVRRARVEPKPYLLACAMIANAASFVLPIANPANLVVFGKTLPPLAPWLRLFLLPSVFSIASTYFCLRLLSRHVLQGKMNSKADGIQLSPQGRLALFGICIAAATLVVTSGLGFPLGLPTCITGVFALLLISFRNGGAWKAVLRGVSWSVVPLVAGLFMIVAALNRAGMLRLAQAGLAWLARVPDGLDKLVAAGVVAGLSNIMNNLPVGLASGSALQPMHSAGALTHAVLIGVDLGPNLSVTGSLATILWLIALRRDDAEITAWEFLKTGMIVMPVSVALSVLSLHLVQ
ncbi:MAG TPA: arsenic transporter [Pseudacidobacterium sp.]|nr:arsenic transporter [Pseudacidobacterium sp.]